jgi:DNA-binding LytR/AlgR family response regulator
VLVVEDQFLLAQSLRYALASDFEVLGPAATCESALRIVEAGEVDLAVLDIDLHGQSSAPVALALRERGRPLLFLTGYDSTSRMPPELRDVPTIAKPAAPEEVVQALLALAEEWDHGPKAGS